MGPRIKIIRALPDPKLTQNMNWMQEKHHRLYNESEAINLIRNFSFHKSFIKFFRATQRLPRESYYKAEEEADLIQSISFRPYCTNEEANYDSHNNRKTFCQVATSMSTSLLSAVNMMQHLDRNGSFCNCMVCVCMLCIKYCYIPSHNDRGINRI